MEEVKGRTRFKCIICLKHFSNISNLSHHYRTHIGDKLFKCEICEKAFSQKQHVIQHIKIHTGKKPFVCDFCNSGFIKKNDLDRHTESNIHKLRVLKMMEEVKGRTRFKCLKSYAHSSDLSKHKEKHSCEKCGKSYADYSELSKHKNKPYLCDECEKCFVIFLVCDLCGLKNIFKENHCKICPRNQRIEHTASLSYTNDNPGGSSSSQNFVTNTGLILPTQFVDCGPTIKEEIKEENMDFQDPLRLS